MLTLYGSYLIRAQPAEVWQFLTTPERITPLLPQVQNWTPTAVVDQFHADLLFVWGGKTVCFPQTIIQWRNNDDQRQAEMKIVGGSARSSFTAETEMQLQNGFGQQTEIVWEATAVFTGTLAEIPTQLSKTAAMLVINQFFRAVRTELTTLPAPSQQERAR